MTKNKFSDKELLRKEVPEEMMEKILKFAQSKERFVTKEVFQKFENNPEFLLRYALNNLRIDNKIKMYGNKKGAFYSTNFNLVEIESDGNTNTDNSDLKQRILDLSSKFTGWFSRTDLKIEDVSIPVVLSAIKELVQEEKLDIQGELRWTKYRLVTDETEKQEEDLSSSSLYSDILDFIKKHKVVTIPMIIEELGVQRYNVVEVLGKLCEDEEIYHEGIKKASKYIYKTVNDSEVERLVDQLKQDRKVEQRIDELSNFLICEEEYTAVSIGLDSNEVLQVKFLRNGVSDRLEKFEDLSAGIKFIYQLTDVKNG
jgi:(2Fe-2S) ferredoxin